MAKIPLSIVLGFFSLVVFIGIGELFESKGVVAENVASGIALFLYLTIAQFLAAPHGSRTLQEKRPTMIAMGAPVLVICLLVIVGEGSRQLFAAALIFVAGCLGILTGATVAGWVTFRTVSSAQCRRLLLVSAVLVTSVVFVLVVRILPLIAKAGSFPDGTPGPYPYILWGFVVLNALVAAFLFYLGFRNRDGNRPTSSSLARLTFFAFLSACAFAPPAFAYREHGPILLTASNLAQLCLVAEIVVTALVGSLVVRPLEDRKT